MRFTNIFSFFTRRHFLHMHFLTPTPTDMFDALERGKNGRYIHSLAVAFPDLCSQWHPTKNGDLRPVNFSPASDKKMWWICTSCPCGQVHEWVARIANRSISKCGCPYCKGNSKEHVCGCQTLSRKFPALCSEIHPTKNGSVDPRNYSFGSREFVWWTHVCSCGESHEWYASIKSRTTRGKGCPSCRGGSHENMCHCRSLLARNPEISGDWHPTKNGDITPEFILYSTNQKFWWLCSKIPRCLKCGVKHEWEASPHNRAAAGTGCPYCAIGSVVFCKCNSLAGRYPQIARELVNANGDSISYSTSSTFQFQCPEGHIYTSRVSNRTSSNKTGCPDCSSGKSERQMLAICDGHSRVLSREMFPMKCPDDLGNIRKLRPDAVVTLINGHRVLVEVDGPHHFAGFSYGGSGTDFEDQIRRDRAKEEYARVMGWSIIRISYLEFHAMELWMNVCLERVFSSNQPLKLNSNVELYSTLYSRMYKES